MNKAIEAPIQKVGRMLGGVLAVLLCLIGGGCDNPDSGEKEPPTGTPVPEESTLSSADGERSAGRAPTPGRGGT